MTASEAETIARRLARERGWPWSEPVAVRRLKRLLWIGRERWQVLTHAGFRGGNVLVVVDGRTGDVVSAGFNSR